MGKNWSNLLTEMIGNLVPFVKVFKAMGIDIGEAISSGVKSGFQAFQNFKPAEIAPLNLPGVSGLSTVPTPSGGGSGKKGGGGAADKDAQRQLELQNKLKQSADELLVKAQERLRVIEGITDFERIQAEGASAVNDVKREYTKLLEEAQQITDSVVKTEVEQTLKAAEALEIRNEELETRKEIQELQEGVTASIDDEIAKLEAILQGREDEYQRLKDIKKLEDSMRNTGLDPSGATALVDQRNELKAQVEEFRKMEDIAKNISGTIASEFTNAISSIIQGTKSMDEAFSDMLASIGQSFIDMAMQIIQEQIKMIINGMIMKALGIVTGGAGGGFGSGPSAPMIGTGTNYFGGGFTPMNFFAEGGRPPVGEVSIVGERGPELFVPDQPGTVLSNQQSRSAMERYNSGSSNESGASPINLNVTATQFGDEKFVKVDDLKVALAETRKLAAADGAKGGFVRTMSSLKNNRSNRKTIGL